MSVGRFSLAKVMDAFNQLDRAGKKVAIGVVAVPVGSFILSVATDGPFKSALYALTAFYVAGALTDEMIFGGPAARASSPAPRDHVSLPRAYRSNLIYSPIPDEVGMLRATAAGAFKDQDSDEDNFADAPSSSPKSSPK